LVPAPIGKQGLTAIFPVLAERSGALASAIEARASAISEELSAIPSVHSARLVLVEDRALADGQMRLVLATTFDGGIEAHLAALWRHAGRELEPVLAHCKGFGAAGTVESFVTFVTRHALSASVQIHAHPELTVSRIHADAELRRALSRWLTANEGELRALPPLEIARRAQARLGSGAGATVASVAAEVTNPLVAAAPAESVTPLVASALTLTDWIALAVTFVRSLVHDCCDQLRDLWNDTLPSSELARRVASFTGENGSVHCFSHLAELRPGRFRRSALRFALRLLAKLSRGASAAGKLRQLEVVRSARWMVLEDGRLLFLAELDGSVENALARAAERARAVVGMLWSHTRGFPTSFGWCLGAAGDPARLRSWAYAGELRTPLRYSAYPSLGARELRENAEIRDLVTGALDTAQARRLLLLLRD
jgi:hypothetical protein